MVAGCAQLAPTSARFPSENAPATAWSGRLSLTVEGDASASWSAAFELRGAPDAGELTLYTPLGGTAARLSWGPAGAELARPGADTARYASLDQLAEQATGTPLPVAALFDWLRGRATDVPGWRADLAGLPQSRLQARRHSPAPAAELRLRLDR